MANPFEALAKQDDTGTLEPALPPSLLERYALNTRQAFRTGTVFGALSDAMSVNMEGMTREGIGGTKRDRDRDQAQYEALPEWQTWAEGGVALLGQLTGAGASIENFIPTGLGAKVVAKTGMAAGGLMARVFAGAVDGATVNALADAAIQGIDIESGMAEDFDLARYGQSLLLGTAIGGIGGGVAKNVDTIREKAAARIDADNPFHAFDDSVVAPPTPAERLAAAPDMAIGDVLATPKPVAEAVPSGGAPVEPIAAPPSSQSPALAAIEPDQVSAAVKTPEELQTARVLRTVAPIGKPAPRPQTVLEFIAANGGLRPDGELAARDLKGQLRPGKRAIVREDGLPLDDMRALVEEAGYFNGYVGTADDVNTSSESQLLDLIDREIAGEPALSMKDADLVEAWRNTQDRRAANEQMYSVIKELVFEVQNEFPDALPDDIIRKASLVYFDDGIDQNPNLALQSVMLDEYYKSIDTPLEYADGRPIEFRPLNDDDFRWEPDIETGTASLADASRLDPQRQQIDGGSGDGGTGTQSQTDGTGAALSSDGQTLTETGADGLPQTLLDGFGVVTDKDRLALAAGKPLRGGNKAPGGMFDETITKQTDIADFMDMAAPVLNEQRVRPDAGIAGTAADNIARVRETADALAQSLNIVATRQGRMGGKGKLGQYATRSGVVRVKSLDDFDTLTHEYGHAFQMSSYAATAFMKRHSAAFEKLDYDPNKGRDTEGFAEFFRLWLTNRAYVEKTMPEIAADFDTVLDTTPDIKAGIDAARDAWSAFMEAPSTSAVASTITSARRKGWAENLSEDTKKTGWFNTIHDFLSRSYTFFLDGLNPLGNAVRELQDLHFANTGRQLDLKVSEDPYKLARMSRGAYAAGHMDIMHGIAPYRGLNPQTGSLRDAIIEATGSPNALSSWNDFEAKNFGSYLWSRRALGEWERFEAGLIPNAPDKLTKGDHLTNVRELEAQYPQYQSGAAKVHEWSRALWKKKFDAGLIDEATYQGGLEIKDYVPGLRDFSNETDAKAGGAPNGKRGGSMKGGLTKRFRGSKRDVINPLESLAADAYETAQAIARNDIVKALDRLALTAGVGGGAIAERVPAREMKALMVDPMEAVENAAKQAGLGQADIVLMRDALEGSIGDEKAAIFRPAVINERGEPIVFWRDGGKLQALRLADGEFGKEIYRALTAMNQMEKNLWVDLVAMPAQWLRIGITKSLSFIFSNVIRDGVLSWVLYGKVGKRITTTLQGVRDDWSGTEVAKEYSRLHGLSGGQEVASLRDAAIERDLSSLRNKGWFTQRLTSWRGALEIAETSETAIRLGLFRTFREEAQARGLSDYEAGLEAAWRARDYIDFDRRGSGMAAITRVITFLNVSMQGTDKVYRHMIDPLVRKMTGKPMTAEDNLNLGMAVKSWARLMALVTAGVSLHALMSQNEDHDEISLQTRSTHFMVKFGEKWLAVPKPFEMATAINLGEAAYDAIIQKDPSAMGKWRESLWMTLAPPSVMEGNPSIRNYFEARTNTNMLTGADLVPEQLQGMEPWLQYTERTSEIAKSFGELTGFSPIVAEHLFVSHFGTAARSFTALTDMAYPDAPSWALDDAPFTKRFIKDASKGAQSVTKFWQTAGQRAGTHEGRYKTWRAMQDSGDAAGAADYYAGLTEPEKAYVAVSAMDAKVRRMHPLIRARDGVTTIGAIRRGIAGKRLENADGTPLVLDAKARNAADDILSDLQMAMTRNALILDGAKGWGQRKEIDEAGYVRELQALSPQLAQRLADGFATAKVNDWAAVRDVWPELKQRALDDGSAAFVDDLLGQMTPALPDGVPIKRAERPELIFN